ncbi:MAG: hypothetical protein LQ337_007962 [Flavoplaca oasis]|nr:MAG: hypothetical protein LQ337_007962 [Flavoplaca oasis]
MISTKSQLTALVALLSLCQAHVKVESPVPYGVGLNTNPLLPDGSDFPCKQREDVYKLVKNNVMAVGQPQTLSFQGQATHGGGSCQISLSRDKNPTKDSIWKVILSIEGGCPSKHPANVGEDPSGYGADKFQYSIPPQISPGDYTWAFTWFNKIGERETYMNCAPITVTATSEKRFLTEEMDVNNNSSISDRDDRNLRQRDGGMDSLPDMFMANIGNGCSTAASGTDLKFPDENLGRIVQRINTGPLTPPVGDCSKKSSNQPKRIEDGLSAPPATPSTSTLAAVAPLTTSESVAITVQPQPESQSAPPAVQPETPTSEVLPLPIASHPPVADQSPAPIPHIIDATTGSCPTPGKSLCSEDGLGFGTCDQNHKVLFQPVPIGTKCDKALGVMVHARHARHARHRLHRSRPRF